MTYGYQVHGHDDKLLVAAKKRNKYGTEKILPGTLLVNQIPLCLYFPPLFLHISSTIDLAHTLQYATFPSGYRGLPTSH